MPCSGIVHLSTGVLLMPKRRLSSIALAALLPFAALIHSVAANADTLDDIKSRGTMTVAIDPTFAPYEYTDANNNIVGFDPTIMAAVAKHLGVKIEYQRMSFSGIIPGLLAHSFDIEGSALNVTAKRAKRLAYVVPTSKTVNGAGALRLQEDSAACNHRIARGFDRRGQERKRARADPQAVQRNAEGQGSCADPTDQRG